MTINLQTALNSVLKGQFNAQHLPMLGVLSIEEVMWAATKEKFLGILSEQISNFAYCWRLHIIPAFGARVENPFRKGLILEETVTETKREEGKALDPVREIFTLSSWEEAEEPFHFWIHLPFIAMYRPISHRIQGGRILDILSATRRLVQGTRAHLCNFLFRVSIERLEPLFDLVTVFLKPRQ